MDISTPADNAAFLRGALLRRLLAVASGAVLDVGCGQGQLLSSCAEADLPATGLEASIERATQVRAAGHGVILGRGERLPFAEASVPWVIMRHVAHHLADAAAGVRELARVARCGVIVAEPWRPLDRPEQRMALDIDLWCKAHHRRQGRQHHPDVAATDLAAWLRSGSNDHALQVEVSEVLRPALLAREVVEAELRAAVADLPAEHPEVRRVDEWLFRADETGVGATGSVIVVARLDPR